MSEQENLFMDKIKLSALVVDKEGQLIGSYASLQRRLRAGYIELEDIEIYSEYHNSWRLINELYSFLYHAKIKPSKKIEVEDKAEIKRIMQLYNDTKKEVSYDDLKIVYDIILNCVAVSGYHDDKVSSGEEDEEAPKYF